MTVYLDETLNPIDPEERVKINQNWKRIMATFTQLQRHINFLAGEDVEEILARIQTAIDGAQDATLSANEAVEIINEELSKIATAISNAESARDKANTAATNATNAAQEANTAKQNADVATLNANNAADAANTAKQNTETATQEARTATTNANNATNAAEQATEEAEAITEIMNTLKIELEALQTALNGIVAIENARVEAEEERVTNELARIDAEDERNEKESTRVNAENVRIEAEEGRITNELARIAAENERNEKEATRTTAETNRVNAENTRIEAEEERTQAHHTLCELLNNFQSLSYDASSTYDFPAIVSYNGSTYIALQEVTGIVPNNDGINWRLVAQRGVDGNGSVSSVNGIFPDPSGNVQLNVASNWDSIEGKPSTFTPGTHKHAISDVDGLQDALDNVAVDDTKYVFTDGSKAMNNVTIGTRKSDTKVGVNSFAQGYDNTASGAYSHAEGYSTKAIGRQSHAEGSYTIADGDSAHAEGTYSVANGDYSHAKGYCSYAGLGTLYNVNRTDDNLKTITLDSVDGLLVGDKLDLKSYGNGEYTLLNIPITAIEGNVVTVDTTEYISAKYAIKRNPDKNYEVVGASAEGSDTISVGGSSHAEGARTIASGVYSHAEGCQTIATGVSSHAEGSNTIASGAESHAEGTATKAEGRSSHAEGCQTIATGVSSHAEGYNTTASGDYSHTEGYETTANGEGSHVEGSENVAFGIASHAEGYSNGVGTSYSHAKGRYNLASNGVSYEVTRKSSNGVFQVATVDGLSVGTKVDISRNNKPPLMDVAIAKINGTSITLDTTEDTRSIVNMLLRNEETSHKPTYVEGESNTASGNNSHSEGRLTHASGEASHSEGISTIAKGKCSHAGGYGTKAENYASTAIGRYSKMSLTNATEYDATADAFVIGNGTSSSSRSNAFRVAFDGSTYGLSAFNSIGADYAEYFEWLDGNVDDEERIGFVVTLEGDKIRKANENDLYILGIISSNPSVIGDSYQDDWQGKYVTDEWGRVQYHWVDVEHEEPQPPIFNEQTGEYEEQESKKVTRKEYHPILNEDWSNEMEYTPREQRPEWDAVGLVGKLYVRDDGTCQVNNFAKVGVIEGVLTHSDETTNMRVMERVAPNIVRVFIK